MGDFLASMASPGARGLVYCAGKGAEAPPPARLSRRGRGLGRPPSATPIPEVPITGIVPRQSSPGYPERRSDPMARSRWIMPRADAACGRVFHPDRKTAEGHRIALELWNQATGHTREGHRLAVYRCGRCGGFHIATRKVEPQTAQASVSTRPYAAEQEWANPEVERYVDALDWTSRWRPCRMPGSGSRIEPPLIGVGRADRAQSRHEFPGPRAGHSRSQGSRAVLVRLPPSGR